MLQTAGFPAFGRPGSGSWRRVLRTMYKIAIGSISIFQHCASARDFADFNNDFGYGDVISRQNFTISWNRPGSLQMHCGSFPATPNDAQRLLEWSTIKSEIMKKKHHFLHPGNRKSNEISAINCIRTAFSASIGSNSPHSTFWSPSRASYIVISMIKCRITTRKCHFPKNVANRRVSCLRPAWKRIMAENASHHLWNSYLQCFNLSTLCVSTRFCWF